MLEKTLGNTLATKLSTIILMRQISMPPTKYSMVIGCYTLHGTTIFLPEEAFCEKNCMANNGTLQKNLFYDITWQARVPAAIASLHTLNCYDRIVHAMTTLVFQTFGVPTSAVDSMLGTNKNMKFFLWTGFGDCTTFTEGGISMKTQ